jgi:uncharacterized damage-inducible protein DinB
MDEALRTLFDHHAWATLQLIDHCAALPAEELDATVPGTAGTIRETLIHLVAADQRYLRRMGEQPEVPVNERDDPQPGLDRLREAFALQGARWQALAGRAGELNVVVPAEGPQGWPEVTHAERLLFLQAVHHGNDHRTHICTIIGARGLEAPVLDGWRFWEDQRLER